jgi:hypothetical protein
MADVTYYVAMAFVRTEEGDLVPAEAKDFQDPGAARREAQRLSALHPGALAFSRTGDPASGDFASAVILIQYGEIGEVE